MENWVVVMLVAAGLALGYLVRILEQKGRRKRTEPIGLLVVDEEENPAQVYLQVKVDPKAFMDGEIVQLEVAKIKG